ncbi:hypothetical protein [Oleidesulfovibrio sp.]|uniref:hypothetical protein n=1 Tax=Oleidesulfovibrio sp. TaxID=2909707 RepID=UPI003A8BFE18
MNYIVCFMFCFVLLTGSAFANMLEVRIRKPQSVEDATHSYYAGLLQLALNKTEKEYGPAKINITNEKITKSRAFKMLEDPRLSRIDVEWAGTSLEWEQKLLPVRIPLLGGLLGYRALVTNKAVAPDIAAVRSMEEMKRFVAVQGTDWTDSDILEAAGLPVKRVVVFEHMYALLKRRGVDYFPRGINEAYAEVAGAGDPNLVVVDSVLLHYALPMYFFTSLTNKALALRIEAGLRAAIKDGSFAQYMREHPATAGLFPLSRFNDSVVLHMDNPFLSPETPLDDPSLWINVGKGMRIH